jgi:hypothetical protein
MTRPPADRLAHSVQERLRNVAQRSGRPFAELLERYALERFLHRLGSSDHGERFVLKGALRLPSWLRPTSRPTRDVDLLGPEDLTAEALRQALIDILRVPVQDDGLSFNVDSIAVRAIRGDSDVLGLRAKFDGNLGRVRPQRRGRDALAPR